MEFVGRHVRKGSGMFTGIVKSYDSSSGSFEIVYEDGDSEELDFPELAALVDQKVGPGQLVVDHRSRIGRKPKKRRRVVDLEPGGCAVSNGGESAGGSFVSIGGNGSCLDMNSNVDLRDNVNGAVLGGIELGNGSSGRVEVDLNETLGEKCGGEENSGIIVGCENGRLHANSNVKPELDLNAAFSLNLNEEAFDLNEDDHANPNLETGLKDRGCIDLNVDANGELDENPKEMSSVGGDGVETLRKECPFDLNMGLDEEIKEDQDLYSLGQPKGDSPFDIVKEETQNTLETSRMVEVNGVVLALPNFVAVKNHHSSNNLCAVSAASVWKANTVSGDTSIKYDSLLARVDSNAVSEGNQVCAGTVQKEGPRRRGRRRKVAGITNLALATVSANSNGLKEDRGVIIDENQPNVGSAYKDSSTSRRKRRKHSDDPVQETVVLRRSARKGSAKNYSVTTVASKEALESAPAEVSALNDETPRKLYHQPEEEHVVLPAKVQLPPSSKNIDLGGIHTLDVFSIYACLRSFSTLLFISPFKLEDFVEALTSNLPSVLFDCIHFSILQILRTHLEHLSDEGSESASDCLRSLDWDLLDLITWPLFMVEYFLVHSSGAKPGLNPSELKLFKCDYYRQPVSVKVGMLRRLCDDMIETEAIRSELNRRTSGAELDLELDRNDNLGSSRKRKGVVDVVVGSSLTEEAVDDTMDRNIDECCLCKMDGNLICCDGCPAAYHSKCVGVANDSLPEGDWYCPECAIDGHKSSKKHRKAVRGAELLGVDPHGRLYFSSCGYLLVSDSSDAGDLFSYYHRDDLHVVIHALKSSGRSYGTIVKAIFKNLDVPVGSLGTVHQLSKFIPSLALASSETGAVHDNVNERKSEGTASSGQLDASKSVSPTYMSSEGSAVTTQIGSVNQNYQKEGPDCSTKSADMSNNPICVGKNLESNAHSSAVNYINYYSFGQTASRVAEDLMPKSLDKTVDGPAKSDEEMISAQMKIILKSAPKLRWPNIQSTNSMAQKEKCGWCFLCRAPMDDLDCLFTMSFGPSMDVSAREVDKLQSKRNQNGHLMDVVGHIISFEDRLQGLLLGPWLKPNYSSLWRENILKATDIASVKCLLLKLESSIHQRAISTEWLKHVDSSAVLGSSSHIVIAQRMSSKSGVARKRSRSSAEPESGPSNKTSGLCMFWWRGGKMSRKLFSWKVLPVSLASKAARQGGGIRIPGILYPESSDFVKRSKAVAWRAAVESSSNAELLALQVRELDSNIRWDEIENWDSLSAVDKEYKKAVRLFKKVIVRRKSAAEGGGTKYLLDFGQRRSIPDVVSKYGSIVVEESSNERKKYWLSESLVPLHLLKNYEEKRVARKSSKTSSGKLSEENATPKSASEKRGFSYLFARAEKSEFHQCGHCKKDVPSSEAVCCQYCKDFFHKRHVRKSGASSREKCSYTCHRCLSGKLLKIGKKAGKGRPKVRKIVTVSPKVQQLKSKVSIARRSVRLRRGRKGLRGRPPLIKNDKKAAPGMGLRPRGRPPLIKNDQKAATPGTGLKRPRGRPRLIKDDQKAATPRKSLRGRPPRMKDDDEKSPAVVVPLRRSARQATTSKAPANKNVIGDEKGKQLNLEKVSLKKTEKGLLWQKKRSFTRHSYWLNGLLLSARPEDERVEQFRNSRFFSASQGGVLDPQPKCCLCDEASTSTSNYISCESCEVWYHGDAFGLDPENIDMVIGFRCHSCRQRNPPTCPLAGTTRSSSDEPQISGDAENNADSNSSGEVHLDGSTHPPCPLVGTTRSSGDKPQISGDAENNADPNSSRDVHLDGSTHPPCPLVGTTRSSSDKPQISGDAENNADANSSMEVHLDSSTHHPTEASTDGNPDSSLAMDDG
ncbi:unnamed protein product [Linum tenue]|uniref:Uncharacterized protein n=1 Tax=Linum tenue TaxID=586396 RepID=A0AAV0QPJ2_9ROSI|nr:unnamed protein product [Linum tenue]